VDLYSLDEGKDGGETFVEAFELADVEMKGLGGWSLDDLGSAEEMLASLGRNSRRDDESPKAEMVRWVRRRCQNLSNAQLTGTRPTHPSSSTINVSRCCSFGIQS
jgi:hypothetical protein